MDLTRDEILRADDRKVVEIAVPEWNGSVHLRPMSGLERDEFDKILAARSRKDGSVDISTLRAVLVALTACDASGRLLFSLKDAAGLNRKSARAIMRLYAAAQEMNGLSPEAVKELLGNLDGEPSAGSGSGSPSSSDAPSKSSSGECPPGNSPSGSPTTGLTP